MDNPEITGSSTYLAPEFNASRVRESEYVLPEVRIRNQAAKVTPSHYAEKGLREAVEERPYNSMSGSNPIQKGHSPLTVTGAGLPVSADRIRAQVENLQNAIYTPALVDGYLYFIPVESDLRTARTDSNMSVLSHTGLEDSESRTTTTYSTISVMAPTPNKQLDGNSETSGVETAYSIRSTPGPTSARTCNSFGTYPTTARSGTSLVPISPRAGSVNTATSRSTITATGFTPRSARSRTASELSTSAFTAISNDMLTAAEVTPRTAASRSYGTAMSDSAHSADTKTSSSRSFPTAVTPSAATAVSRTILTASPMSPGARTAQSRTMVTANVESPMVRTANSRMTDNAVSPAMSTALSRTMLTADVMSPAVRTANSRTTHTADAASPMIHTAQSGTMLTANGVSPAIGTAMSRTMITASPASPSVKTAASRRLFSNDSSVHTPDAMRTAVSKSATPRTAVKLLSCASPAVRTANSLADLSAMELLQDLRTALEGANEQQLQTVARVAEREPQLLEALNTAVAYASHEVLTANSETTRTASEIN